MEGSVLAPCPEMVGPNPVGSVQHQQNNKRSRLCFANQIPSQSPEGLRPLESPLLCPITPAYKRVRTDAFLVSSRDRNRLHQSSLAREFLAAAGSCGSGEGAISGRSSLSYKSSSFCPAAAPRHSAHDVEARETTAAAGMDYDDDFGMETSDRDVPSLQSQVSDVSTVASCTSSPSAPPVTSFPQSAGYISLAGHEKGAGPTLLNSRDDRSGSGGGWGAGGGKAVAEMLRACDFVYL